MAAILSIRIDDGSGKEFDAALRDTLPDRGDLHLITKKHGTVQGRAIAMLTFTVQLPSGETRRAQTVVTVRHLLGALYCLAGAYPELVDRPVPGKQPPTVEGEYRSCPYKAVLLEKVYLVSADGVDGISIAGDEEEARALAANMIEQALAKGAQG